MYRALVNVIMFLLFVRRDRSSSGHILGAPQRMIAERDLSPANVSLLRIILHSAMLAGAYHQPEVKSKETDKVLKYGFVWAKLFISRLHCNKIATWLNALRRVTHFGYFVVSFVSPLIGGEAINVPEWFSRKDSFEVIVFIHVVK